MNANQLINMAIRMIMRRGINAGINRGIDMASRGGKRPEDMTAEEREAAANNHDNAHGARRGLNIARRFMR